MGDGKFSSLASGPPDKRVISSCVIYGRRSDIILSQVQQSILGAVQRSNCYDKPATGAGAGAAGPGNSEATKNKLKRHL